MTPAEIEKAVSKGVAQGVAQATDPKITPPPDTGNSRKIVIGLIGALLLASITAGTTMLIRHNSRLAVVETKETVAPERVAVVETKVEKIEKSIDTIEKDGKASNSKLDALLGRFNVRAPPK